MFTARRIAIRLVLVVVTGSLAACGGGPSVITVRDAWARPVVAAPSNVTPTNGQASAMMMGGDSSVVYMTIINTGDSKDTLIGISSDVAVAVRMHRTEIKNNVASMNEIKSVDIPAHGEMRFDPGSYHVVLANVRRTLAPGDMIDLTLTFKNAG